MTHFLTTFILFQQRHPVQFLSESLFVTPVGVAHYSALLRVYVDIQREEIRSSTV